MGKQHSNNDPLGILKKNGTTQEDPLGILKKKDSIEPGLNGLETPVKPSNQNGQEPKIDAVTDHLGILSKKPSTAPSIEFPEQLKAKADVLLHDINSLTSSDTYKASIKTMDDLSKEANLLNALYSSIGKPPEDGNEMDSEAYNARVKEYNTKREEFISKKTLANKALDYLRTIDEYTSEYNGIVDKLTPEKMPKQYDEVLLKQTKYFLEKENPSWSQEKVDVEAKKAIDESGVMVDPDAGLNKSVSYNLVKAAQSAITDLLPAGARAKTAMVNRSMYQGWKDDLKSLEGKSDNEKVTFSGLSGKGPRTYTVAQAKPLLKQRLEGSLKQILTNLKEASTQLDEASQKKLIQHIDQVDWSDPKSIASFMSSSIGQAVGQIPLSLISFGSSSEILETGTTYMDGIQQIMNDNPGITYKEIIEKNLDDSAAASAFGSLSAMLEFTGANEVFKATGVSKIFKNIMRDNFGKRFMKAGLTEFSTEFLQSAVTQYGAGRVARYNSIDAFENIKWRNALSEGLSGLIGGGTLAGVGSSIRDTFNKGKTDESINTAREKIDTTNPESVDQVAKEIQQKIDEDAVQIESTDEVPVRQQQEGGQGIRQEDTQLQGPTGESQQETSQIETKDVQTPEKISAGLTTFIEEDGFSPEGHTKAGTELNTKISELPGIENAKVYDSEGLYADTIEPSYDLEITVDNDQSISNIFDIVSDFGKKYDQNDVFLSSEVTADHPNARPGVEVKFTKPYDYSTKKGKKAVESILQKARDKGIDGFTLIKNDDGKTIGFRTQYIPEISGRWSEGHLTVDDFADNADQWVENIKNLSNEYTDDEISEFTPKQYSTQVIGKEEYGTVKENLRGTDVGTELGRRVEAISKDREVRETGIRGEQISEGNQSDRGIQWEDRQQEIANIKDSLGKESETPQTKLNEARDELGKGIDMLARVMGVVKQAVPTEGDSFEQAIKHIGNALIKAGEATVDNVNQKVKEYIKKLGFTQVTNDQVDQVYPLKPKKEGKKQIEGKKEKGYEKRQLEEFSTDEKITAAIKENGLYYEPVPWMRVNPIANDMLSEATSDTDNAVDNVTSLLNEIGDTPISKFQSQEELSTLYALLYHKALDFLKNAGELYLFKKYSDKFSSTGREFGRFTSAMQADSSPEAISNRLTSSLLADKEQAMAQEGVDNETVAKDIKQIQEKLRLSEEEINRLNDIVADLTDKINTRIQEDKEMTNAERIRRAQNKRKKAVNTINDILKKSRGQLSSGPPLNIVFDSKMIGAIKDIVSSYIEEGYYKVDEIRQKVLSNFNNEKELRALIEENWDKVYDEEVQNKAIDQQSKDFIEKISTRVKSNILTGKSKAKSAEEILLSTLLSKVGEDIKKKSKQPIKTALAKVREGIINRLFSDGVWKEAMNNVKSWLEEIDMPDEQKAKVISDIEDSVSGFMETPFADADLRRAIKDQVKELGLEINKIIKSHWTEQNKEMKSLAEKLILKLGLPVKDALAIQARVEKGVQDIFDETRVKEIKKMLNFNKEGEPIVREPKSTQRVVDKIMEAINMGLLDDANFQDLFADKYGFNTLTKNDIQKIQRFNDLINKHQGSEMSRRYMQELMNYTESLKNKDAELVYNSVVSLMIRSMLTALSTIAVNIPIGSYMAYKANTIPRFLTNPVGTIMAIKAFNQSGLSGIGRKSFLDIMKNGYNILDEGVSKFDERRDTRGDYIDHLINTYDPKKLWANVKDAKTSKDKTKALSTFTARTYLKLYQLANFAKAFDVLINHKGEELSYFIDEFNNQAKLLGKNKLSSMFDWKAGMHIAEMVKNKMGYDEDTVISLKDEVSSEIDEMKARGEKVPAGYEQRRLKEKMQELRDEDKLKRARDFVKTSTLMEAPVGLLGMGYEAVNAGLSLKDTDWTKGFFKTAFKASLGLFLRISVTSAQRAIENIPGVGLVAPGIFYDLTKVPEDPSKPNSKLVWKWGWQDPKKRNARLMVHASSMAVLGLAAMSMFDWDDDEDKLKLDPDRWLDITGYGTGQFNEIEQLNRLNGRDKSVRERKNFMISVKIGDKWFDILPARLLPQLLPTIALLGSMRDEAEINPTVFNERGSFDQFVKGFDDIGLALTDQSFATIPRFVSKTVYAGQREGFRGVAAESFYATAGPLRSALYPNMLRDVNNEINALRDDVKKTGSAPARVLFRDIPVMEDMMLEGTFDIFGYPIKKDSKVISALDNNPAVNLIVDNVTDFKNINKERYETKAWQAKMEYHPNLIIKGYWAKGVDYDLKMIGAKAYGEQMRQLWEQDLAKGSNSVTRRFNTEKLAKFIHSGRRGSWHRIASEAAKKAIKEANAKNDKK